MSSAQLQGGASGTGSMTILAPNTNSNQTVTLPDATGTAMVSGNMPAFSAYQSSAQALSTNTYTKVQLQSEEFDTNGCFDSTTNYRFTPTVAGYYQINGGTYVGGNALIGIYKNGSEYKRGAQIGSAGTMAQLIVSSIVYFNGSTDYVELWAYTGSANSLTASSVNTYFNGAMVRAA